MSPSDDERSLFEGWGCGVGRDTGHLMAPLVAHVFCNVMGLPALGQAFTAPYSPGLLLSL
jgi:hypothetical protein